jgi:hypothetical protein
VPPRGDSQTTPGEGTRPSVRIWNLVTGDWHLGTPL